MVGILVITHYNLGTELVAAADMMGGKIDSIQAISVDPKKDTEKLRKEISMAIKRLDNGEGVLIITDMFGGTPSNLSLSFLEEGKVEVLTGVNLPMLIKLSTYREDKTLNELAMQLKSFGQKNINLASEIMNKKVV
ncbi:MAG: PTS sugar transporter subunit IIA [Desulfobacterales bacterium]|nr:PTS sugar transporter subunit IIA [Desulfobacterales bacterium]